MKTTLTSVFAITILSIGAGIALSFSLERHHMDQGSFIIFLALAETLTALYLTFPFLRKSTPVYKDHKRWLAWFVWISSSMIFTIYITTIILELVLAFYA